MVLLSHIECLQISLVACKLAFTNLANCEQLNKLCSCDKMSSRIRLCTHIFGVNSDVQHSTGALS